MPISLLPSSFDCQAAGGCMVAARLIAGAALAKGQSVEVVEGWIQFIEDGLHYDELRFAHTWVRVDGELVDPTLAQFAEYVEAYPFEREVLTQIDGAEYMADFCLNTDHPQIFFKDHSIPAECLPFLTSP